MAEKEILGVALGKGRWYNANEQTFYFEKMIKLPIGEDGRIVRDENGTGQEIRKGDTLEIPEGVKRLYKNIAGRSHPRKVIQSILTIEKRAQHSCKAV